MKVIKSGGGNGLAETQQFLSGKVLISTVVLLKV